MATNYEMARSQPITDAQDGLLAVTLALLALTDEVRRVGDLIEDRIK